VSLKPPKIRAQQDADDKAKLELIPGDTVRTWFKQDTQYDRFIVAFQTSNLLTVTKQQFGSTWTTGDGSFTFQKQIDWKLKPNSDGLRGLAKKAFWTVRVNVPMPCPELPEGRIDYQNFPRSVVAKYATFTPISVRETEEALFGRLASRSAF
jgi:hypothetical protein